MSERVYTVLIGSTGVMMSKQDFAAIGGELATLGIDVDIQPESDNETIRFKIKEAVRD